MDPSQRRHRGLVTHVNTVVVGLLAARLRYGHVTQLHPRKAEGGFDCEDH